MLHLYTSNRLESLVEHLGGVLAVPLVSPLQEETIVVQSLGMRRWLALQLAERLGICANTAFPFPQTFVNGVFAAAFPDATKTEAFSCMNLTWRLMKLLPNSLQDRAFADVAHFLQGERGDLRRFQLAGKIAHVFDQYFAFRPEMILEWDHGREKHWQAKLWRAVTKEVIASHPPALGAKLAQALPNISLAALPSRVSLFGISTLPPFYLQLIGALGERIDVHLFVLEPTPEWWADIQSPREEKRLRSKASASSEMHIERGNALLASLGKAGRDFLHLLAELDPALIAEPFAPPEESSMLRAIQSDIFQLHDPENRRAVAAGDVSIQVHSCHSPMREMEVLHDQLLAMFERDPDLLPKDIVVMMPDIESYAPFVEAVFDTPEEERLRIPFSIADRGARCGSGAIDTFLRILELAGTRLTVTQVFAVLEEPSVQRRFHLGEGDLETIDRWIRKTNIRWGIDAAHRAEFGLPEFSQNSWRTGLDRMLLGYALPGHGERLFEGVLPFDEIEGSLAETLGGFIDFATRLFSAARSLTTPRNLDEWQAALRAILEDFFDPAETAEQDIVQIRRTLSALGDIARDSGFAEDVSLDVVREHLAAALEDQERNPGFLAGAVTFCALKPMRSIPFKVICLAGLNDTAFPRHLPAIGFDLMAPKPRRGDRTLRDDDRYLFLETLLSARDTLLISCVGQSIRDNSAIPPSVLVTELLDYLDRNFENARVVAVHPLQAFSSRYFAKDAALISYSQDNCDAAQAAGENRTAPAAFLTRPIEEPEEEWKTVTVQQLVKFFRHPTAFFLRERLGVTLPREDGRAEDREPFAMNSLHRYQLAQTLTEKALAREPLADFLPLARATGELPAGNPGDALYRKVCEEVQDFSGKVREHVADGKSPPHSVAISLEDWRVAGTFENLYGGTLLHYRCATLKPNDLFAAWIPHLVLNCESAHASVLVANDAVLHFPAEPAAREHLLSLLACYARGLREPLKFFPKTSLKFARSVANTEAKDARQEAAKVWLDGFSKGEQSDPAFDLAFRHDPHVLDEDWEQLALTVFRPLFANCPDAAKGTR